FTSVFPNIGDQQSAALIRTLTSGLEGEPNFSFDKLLAPLREENKQGESLANRLQPFVDSQLFSDANNQAWEQMLRTPFHWVHILQLATLSRDIQKIVTEFALWDLWDYVQNTGNKDRPIPVVLDEIQNLDHSDDSPIDKMLREGRKFGLSLILATQTTSQFNQEQRDRLFQAGHKLFFKPASTEVERFANILAQSTPTINKAEWMRRLNKLEKGQCWSLGPVEKSNGTMVEEPVLVSVTALEDRMFGA
ncbi:ATP-binding protein, partial [Vibrio parahaemolyticus]